MVPKNQKQKFFSRFSFIEPLKEFFTAKKRKLLLNLVKQPVSYLSFIRPELVKEFLAKKRKKKIILFASFFSALVIITAFIGVNAVFVKNELAKKTIEPQKVTTQKTTQIIAGKTTAWIKLVPLKEITNDKKFVALPKSAKNITIKTVSADQAKKLLLNLVKQPSKELTLQTRQQLASITPHRPKSALAKLTSSMFASLADVVKRLTGSLNDAITGPENQDIIQTGDATLVNLSDQIIKQPVEEPVVEEQLTNREKQEQKEEKQQEKESKKETKEETREETLVPVSPEEEPVTSEQEQPPAEQPVELQSPSLQEEQRDPASLISPPEDSLLEIVSPSDQSVIEILEEAEQTPEEAPTAEDEPSFAKATEGQEYVQIEYETPAPEITEQGTDTGKIVTVSSPNETAISNFKFLISNENPNDQIPNLNIYTDVLAYTTIPEIFKVGDEGKIKIKWQNPSPPFGSAQGKSSGQAIGGEQDMAFHAFDLNNNGKLDYVEWTVPHLSDQIFEIIFISKAFKLDQDRNIIEDIYDQVSAQDNNWATIENNQYVRVTFEQILTNQNDITIYARASNWEIGSPNAQIEVYAENGTDLIATFENIDQQGVYKVLLTNLQTPTDVFDLKVVSNTQHPTPNTQLDIDFIVDPTNKYWVGGNYGALSFDYLDDYIEGSNDYVNVFTGTGAFTYLAWVKTADAVNRQQIISIGTTDTNNGAWFFIEGGVLHFDLSNVAGPSGTTNIADGNWHFVEAVYGDIGGSNDYVQLYVDNVAEGGATMSPNITTGETFIGKGLSTYTWYMNGRLDEVVVYNKALSTGELSTWWNSGSGVEGSAATNLVAGYHLNETSGTSAADYSGNSYTGTLYGNGTWSGGKIGANSWNNTLNWSLTSGGAGGAGVPGATDIAIFDSGGTNSASIDANVNVAGFTVSSGYTGTITQTSAYTITVGASGYSQAAGTFTGGSGAVDVNGALALSGGTLTAPSGAFTISGNWANSGGTFTPGTNAVTLDGASTQTINSGGSSFYNVTLSNNTFTLLTNTMTVGGNLVISEGKTPTITATTSEAFTVTGATNGTTGGSAETLTANTTGAVTFTGAVGTGVSTMLTTLTITNSAALLFSSTINITGALTQTNAATGTTTFSNTVAASSATLKGVAFAVNNSFTAAAAGAVAVTNSGIFTLGATGAITAPGGFSTSGAATLSNNITTTNTALTITGALVIGEAATPTLAAGSGAITVTGTTDGATGGSAETLTANTTGAVTFTGAVGTGVSTMLTTLTITNSAALTFSAAVNITGAFSQTNAATGTTGFSSTLAAGSATFRGTTINLGGTTTISGNLTIAVGTLDVTANNYGVKVGGAWSNSGTFTARSGTVMLNNTSSQNLTPGSSSFNNLTLNDGLVGYWKFDEASGTSAADASGYGNTGTNNGATITSATTPVHFTDAKVLSFDGTNDYVSVADSPDWDFGANNFTVGWWEYRTSTFNREQAAISRDATTIYAPFIFGYHWNSNDAVIYMSSNGSSWDIANSKSLGSMPTNEWAYFTVTRNGNTFYAYKNGQQTDTWTSALALASNSNPLSFGRTQNAGYWNGSIDDVRIYNRALSAQEIQALAAGNQPATSSATTTVTSGDLDVNGNLVINAGTLDTGTRDITVAGNWENNGGIFTPNSRTVTLDGTSQSINSSSTFYNLTKTVASADTLTFGQGSTQTISNTLTLNGASGNLLSLRSSSTPTQWNIDPQGTRTISYLDVMDSNNTNATAIATAGLNITDSGNNTNWTFDITPPTVTNATSEKTNGSYTTGEVIDIDITFSEAVSSTGNVTVTLETGDTDRTCTFTVSSATTGTCNYTVVAGDTSSDLTVSSITGTVKDAALNTLVVPATPTTNLAANKALVIDTTAPTVNAGSDQIKNGQFTQDATASDATSGIASYLWTKVSGTGTITFGTATAEDTTISASVDGTFVIRLTVTDNATNSASDDFSLIWDATAPTTSDDFASNNTWVSSSQTITLTANCDVSDCEWTKYCLTASCDPASGTSYTTFVAISTEGTSYFRYASKDNAGSTQTTVEKIVKIDTTAPTGSGISSITADSTSQLTITANTASDSGSGLHSTPYQFEETSANSGATSSGWQASTSYTDSGLSPNIAYTYKVRAKDALSNTSNYSSTSTKYTLANVPVSLAATADSTVQITATWTANSNVSGTEYYIENSTNSTNSGWLTALFWSSSGLTCGTSYSFKIKARNGNSTETDFSSSVNATTSACGGGGLPSGAYSSPSSPVTGFSILINNNASSTENPEVTLLLNAGSDTARMAISNNPEFTNAVQETFQNIKQWILLEGDGNKTVYVKFFTAWGQPSEIFSASIYLGKKAIIQQVVEIPGKVAEGITKTKLPEEIANIVKQITKIPQTIINLLKPKEIAKPTLPPIEEVVKKEAPLAFKQQWEVMPVGPLERFVLGPLPRELSALAQKLPQLKQTLKDIGVSRATDVSKLVGNNLILPGLTEVTSLPSTALETGKVVLPGGISLEQLTKEAKMKIPSEIVFARTGNGLIDQNANLYVDQQGEPQQKITTISGKLLQLIVKPDKPARAIRGYVLFNSKRVTYNLKPETQYLLASVFQVPSSKFQETRLVTQEFDYSDLDNDGIWTAEITSPVVDGEYEIVTVTDYLDQRLKPTQMNLIVVVDPEGYIYYQKPEGQIRVSGAKVTLYWLNPETKLYELWPAKKYQQENPQTTDVTGRYSFLVPEGSYYLKVEARGYATYYNEEFEVKNGAGVHQNIELKSNNWLTKYLDWKVMVILLMFIFLAYNFYRDRKRDKRMSKS